MNRGVAFRELQGLVRDAVVLIGENRVCLGAGCSLSSVQSWSRRRTTQLHSGTINGILPRLRQWESWIPGYMAELHEISHLTSDPDLDWEDLTTELGNRVQNAAIHLAQERISRGCEVYGKLIRMWQSGDFPERYRPEMMQALGHIRHLAHWPSPAEREWNRPRTR